MGSILTFLICAIVVFFIVKIVFKGTKTAFGFLINIAIGGVSLWVLDLFGFGVPITWLTAGIVGILGVPGVIVVFLLKFIFHII